MRDHDERLAMTADIVTAYVARNPISAAEVPTLIADVCGALREAETSPDAPATAPVQPAVPIRRSVTPDAIVCLEDGKRFTSIRRHLWVKHGLTPQEYREKWGVKPDYPIVAPAYAQFRSEMAKSMGLGQKGHQRKKRR